MVVKGVRNSIKNVATYVQGNTVEDIKEKHGLNSISKLCFNENPYAPYSVCKKAIKENMDSYNCYPEEDYIKLKEMIAQKNNFSSNNIALGHGIVGLLETLSKMFLEKDDQVIIPQSTFGLYEDLSKIMGAEIVKSNLKKGKIDVLVTAPINKENIQSEDFNFPGHTEYLMEHFQADEVLMLMVSDVMKIGVATGHVPLRQIPDVLTQDLILRKLNILNKSLLQDFKIRKPRIAVFGLNPHASDGGLLGKEENDIIIPAIQRAKESNIMAFGPYPADGFFGSRNLSKFDAILAMYHDQGLAPFKAISFDEGVNYTAGLNIVRTSPAHGTAYELAGKNEASPASFRNALFLALDIYKNRKEYEGLSSSPLESQDKSDI